MHSTIKTLLLACLICLLACKEDEEPITPGIESVMISGKVKHHNEAIGYASVYIKFNTSIFPGKDTSVYDEMVRADSLADYHFNQVTPGSHFIYAMGFDEGIHDSVFGGVPIVVLDTKQEATFEIPVTE